METNEELQEESVRGKYVTETSVNMASSKATGLGNNNDATRKQGEYTFEQRVIDG